MVLPVPLPGEQKVIHVTFVYRQCNKRPVKVVSYYLIVVCYNILINLSFFNWEFYGYKCWFNATSCMCVWAIVRW